MKANKSSSILAISRSVLMIFIILMLAESSLFAQAQVRIKDIASFGGNREYQIIGYGLVTGLDGSGDKSEVGMEMMRGLLQNMGMEITARQIQSRNLAAVIVTAMLPAYGKAGESIDVTISSIGDARSLQGGVLLPTVLKGGDGQVYAVAQGQISIGGFEGGNAGGGRRGGQKNHLTVGRVPNGAIMERGVDSVFARNGKFSLLLQDKNMAISRGVKEAIDRKFGAGWARIVNPGNIEVRVPTSMQNDPVSFAANIEEITLSIREPNRVVVNERTGTIIVGNSVRISRIAISHNGIRIDIDTPEPAGQMAGAARQTQKQGSLVEVQGETTVDDLVEALNAIGATPRDLIAIFQAIDAAGALHGELKLM